MFGAALDHAKTVFDHLSQPAAPAMLFFVASVVMHRRNLIMALKRLFPKGLWVNLQCALVDSLFVAAPLGAFALSCVWGLQAAGIVVVPSSVMERVPALLVFASCLFIGDFIGYWRHRLEHIRLLWPAHLMHHSDTEMTWYTLFRFHPINRLTTSLIDMLGLAAVGFPLWAIAANGLVRHYYGMFIHANVPWTLGPLGKVFVSPAMHRWHHVAEGPGVGTNFATIFSVFDRVFRTYFVPGPCVVPTGVKGYEESYARQLVLPVTAMVRAVVRLLRPALPVSTQTLIPESQSPSELTCGTDAVLTSVTPANKPLY